MGTIKGRNGIGLTEAGTTKKWKEYIKELYKKKKKISMTQITMMG